MSSVDVDVVVVGGGPAGLAAALWAARYRRSVLLIDRGHHRNQWTQETHGYLALEGASPSSLIERARADLERYPEIVVRSGLDVEAITPRPDGGFAVRLGDGNEVHALRVVLATGVRDLLPAIERFHQFFGRSVFTCPSCDGYEAQGKDVVVLGDDENLAPFALGLLDWASSVAVVAGDAFVREHQALYDALTAHGITVVTGEPAAMTGTDGELEAVHLADGTVVRAQRGFCTVGHVQHSDLPRMLGCEIDDDGCVVVDEHCCTSVEHVFAAGDMTPGPHLVQVAAAKGATAGIAAAVSLRGVETSTTSPPSAPDPDEALAS